jgi:glycosyltransferase involved in cell wall biosynthesis
VSPAPSLPRIAHVPMALSTQGSTLMTVVQRLSEAHMDMGGEALSVLSHNRELVTPGVPAHYVDYTENCPREWFTRTELGVDVVAGGAGMLRPHFGRLYDPAVRALEDASADIVLLYEGHYASASLPRWERLRPVTEVCLYVHNPLSRSYGRRELRRLLGHADRVIFCADHLRNDVEERLGGFVVQTQTVHNGVEKQFLTGAGRSAADGEFVVLFVGRIAEHKGVHLVIESAARVAERTSRPVRVRIIGSSGYSSAGELSAYEVELRRQAARLTVPVEFVPFVGRADLIRELAAGSVACLPSTWAEGLPLVALEAMAAGLPVVCSDSAGMVEACGGAALTAPKGSVEGLADALVRLVEDDAEWERRSRLSWDRVQSFTWERAARQIARQAVE